MSDGEWVYEVAGSTVVVRELRHSPVPEFKVFVDGDEYEVFLGNETDPGTDPDLWYTEVGGQVEGGYADAWDLITGYFLTADEEAEV